MPKSRTNTIRWRTTDDTKLVNAVRQFNGKLTRITKKEPALKDILPSRIDIKTLRKELKEGNRKEYNRTLNRLKRFVKNKSSTQLVKAGTRFVTKWELQNVRDDLQIINARRKKRLEKYKPSPEKGNMSTIKELNLKPKKIENLERINWEKFVESVKKQASDDYERRRWETHKRNYINTVIWELGEYGENLAPILQDIPIEKWETMFEADDPDLIFDYIYSKEETEDVAKWITFALQRHRINVDLLIKQYEWDYEI